MPSLREDEEAMIADEAVRDDAAVEIIRERYARGEVTREEFKAVEQDLRR